MLIGFRARFAELVESGAKVHTIRAPRKDGRVPKIGERLYLYTGLRTKACRKLGEGEIEDVCVLRLTKRRDLHLRGMKMIAGHDAFARADGFPDFDALCRWIEETHDLPFRGYVIRWRLLPREEWNP